MQKLLIFLLLVASVLGAAAQEFEFPATAAQDDAALSQAMPRLARQVIAAYREQDRETYLDNLFRLQLIAGDYDKAAETIVTLRQLRAQKIPGGGEWVNLQYEMFARAKAIEAAGKARFDDAYPQVFRQTLGHLDDRTAFLVIRSIGATFAGSGLGPDRETLKGRSSLALSDALRLVHDYQANESYRQFTPLAKALIEEDNNRRYITVPDAPVKLPNGATICTAVVRPRVEGRIPALLTFTIYAGPTNVARMAASRGYASVVGLTRGKGCSSDPVDPYRYDAEDAAALINWIARQPWSDGRVGMYGGSYSGFTAWAAMKHTPKALKAVAVGASVAPGVDVPMEGSVFWNFIYPWPFYTTDNKELDNDTYNDYGRWNKLNHDWYVSGRAYRELDKIDGKPNPVFDEWISHPNYDAYWQAVIPYGKDFAGIDVPILQTAGYYFGGPGAAVYYFRQHTQHDPKAEHYLVIGPYHHFGAQTGVVNLLGDVVPTLAGLQLDPVALINIEQLRFQFFDHILKHAPLPDLLKDKVNYQVVGANMWKHAPSFDAMANDSLRFYLSATPAEKAYKLEEQRPSSDTFVAHAVDLNDRSDADRGVPGAVVSKELDTWNGIEFVSDPLPVSVEVSGLFSGHLDFTINKKDFDFEIDLYERTPEGEYVQLAPYWTRASYVGHPERRELLTPGKRQHLDFKSIRLMSQRLHPGSRIVAVLKVIKGRDRQINYGTGKDVSDETLQDTKELLQIKWYGGSYLDMPIWRQKASSHGSK
jgi:putative CocE/NonD family hydrolase